MDLEDIYDYIAELEVLAAEHTSIRVIFWNMLSSKKSNWRNIRREVDELDFMMKRFSHYLEMVTKSTGDKAGASHWTVCLMMHAMQQEFVPSTDYLDRLVLMFEQMVMMGLGFNPPSIGEVTWLKEILMTLNTNASDYLPKKSNGARWESLVQAITAIKAYHEKYPFEGKPETEEAARRLARAIYWIFRAPRVELTNSSPLIHALYYGFSHELIGNGGLQFSGYRALVDVMNNLLNFDVDILEQTLGWSTLPVKLFTERHLRLLPVPPSTIENVALKSNFDGLMYIRNRALPRFRLAMVRVKSLRLHEHRTKAVTKIKVLVAIVLVVYVICFFFVASSYEERTCIIRTSYVRRTFGFFRAFGF
jgi:hypothetical protein